MPLSHPTATTPSGRFENRQREQTLRSVISWDHHRDSWKFVAKGGYIHTGMAYDYKREVAENQWASMTRSRSRVNTFYGQAEGEYNPTSKWFLFTPQRKASPRLWHRSKAKYCIRTFSRLDFDLDSSYSWTPSINIGEKMSPADQSVGKQLPYVPKHSVSFTGRLTWESWSFLYKWAFYSERYTMSSNDYTITGLLPKYYMSNVSLEKGMKFKPLDLQLKLAINNLYNEDYLSVLSRPMPGINFEFFVVITPKLGKKKNS